MMDAAQTEGYLEAVRRLHQCAEDSTNETTRGAMVSAARFLCDAYLGEVREIHSIPLAQPWMIGYDRLSIHVEAL